MRLAHTFVEAVERGSIAAASRALGISAAAASKNIQSLEDVLGVQLLNRTTRKITLTDTGEIFYETMKEVVSNVLNLEREISDLDGIPKGRLTVSVSDVFAKVFLLPHLPEFLENYPEIEINLIKENRVSDLTQENIDVGIRTGDAKDQTMIVQKIWDIDVRMMATQKYIDKFGKPEKFEDLLNHNCFNFVYPGTTRVAKWEYEFDGELKTLEPKGNFYARSALELKDLTNAGVGIARIPDFLYLFCDQNNLIDLFPEAKIKETIDVYFYFSERKRNLKSLQVFRSFFSQKIQEMRDSTKS